MSQLLRVSMAVGALSLVLVVPARAQTYTKITVGEPSVWSLEQAHYLLSRIHAANDGLRSKLPSEQDLDPNAANARRIEVLRTMLQRREWPLVQLRGSAAQAGFIET